MRLTLSVLAAIGLALAACGGADEGAGETVDQQMSGTGAGHLGAGPSEQSGDTLDEAKAAAEAHADRLEDRADQPGPPAQ